MRDEDLQRAVMAARLMAGRSIYRGLIPNAYDRLYIDSCSHVWRWRSPIACWVSVLFTRDKGAHSAGWWKNPDYEHCYHLSLSYRDFETRDPIKPQRRISQRIARAFYGDDVRLLWIEPPYSEHGKRYGVHHYRLFCLVGPDGAWHPILPMGEVYSKERTPAGWKSWSEVHGPDTGVTHSMGDAG